MGKGRLKKNIDFRIVVMIAAACAVAAGSMIFLSTRMPEISAGGERVHTRRESAFLRGETQYNDPDGEYAVMVPKGWFPHEGITKGFIGGTTGDVSFTQQELSPQEGGSIIPEAYFSISKSSMAEAKGVANPGEWLAAKGFSNNNPGYKEGLITRHGIYEMMRFVFTDPKTKEDTLYYVFFPDAERVIVFSHAPYMRGNDTAILFDGLMKSFESSRGQR
jgi:hypothetical protein